ncbi:MAG: DUF2062 domain-containing protein [Neomegalonema sp.]|nr:DUF2062 domain-containing protein [Neomegalonema sp.]
MIFKRRERPAFFDRIRALFAPRKGWRRGFVYIGKRVQRLPDTPHRIALGFACGAFASFTPLFTMHLFVAAGLAWLLRANVLAGAFGTIVGNPVSFAFIAAVSLKTGNWLLGRSNGVESIDNLSLDFVTQHPWEFFEGIFTPYLIGGILPGIICAAGFYYLLRPTIATFQQRRRDQLSDRARDLVAQRMSARLANETRKDRSSQQPVRTAALSAPLQRNSSTVKELNGFISQP